MDIRAQWKQWQAANPEAAELVRHDFADIAVTAGFVAAELYLTGCIALWLKADPEEVERALAYPLVDGDA